MKKLSVLILCLLLLIPVSLTGCNLMNSESKTELLSRMKAKYKKIKGLSYKVKVLENHPVPSISYTRNWETGLHSLAVSEYMIYLKTDRVDIMQALRGSGSPKHVSDIGVTSHPSIQEIPDNLILRMLSIVTQKDVVYKGVKKNGFTFVHVFKGEGKEPTFVKEVLVDRDSLLPVKIITSGEDNTEVISTFSNYKVNPKIEPSRFKMGIPPKARRFVTQVLAMLQLPNITVEDRTIVDLPFDVVYYPAEVPQGWQLKSMGASIGIESGQREGYKYELDRISTGLRNKKTGEEASVDMLFSGDENEVKANILDSGRGVNMNNSMLEVIASRSEGGNLKEESISRGKLYWLESGQGFYSLVFTKDGNWFYLYGSYRPYRSRFGIDDQFLRQFVNSLTK